MHNRHESDTRYNSIPRSMSSEAPTQHYYNGVLLQATGRGRRTLVRSMLVQPGFCALWALENASSPLPVRNAENTDPWCVDPVVLE